MLVISHATSKNLLQPIKSTSQFSVVAHHKYGISALVPLASFHRKLLVMSPNVGCFLRLI